VVPMTALPSKLALKNELVAQLEAQLATLERAYAASREAATHDEAKPENDKDTRALEQSYIARGQALRVEEMRACVVDVKSLPAHPLSPGSPARIGALLSLEENEEILVVYLAPHGGGCSLAAGAVQVVTPKSALGRAVLGKCAGDDCEAHVAGRIRELVVVSVV
jgi:hypothetical protein